MDIIESYQIRAGRRMIRWTQKDLAEACQCSIATIADAEGDRRNIGGAIMDAIKTVLEAKGLKFPPRGIDWAGLA